MNKIIFDYSLKSKIIITENKNFDISQLTQVQLKGIANGKMFIFFEPQREYIILETGIIDYLKQLKGVIEEIESGNFEPFSVSCDWYSNSISYSYDEKTKALKIKDINDNDFEITTDYKKFKEAFKRFYDNTVEELQFYYPALKENKNFTDLIL